MSCPNINSPEWRKLVSNLGEDIAYRVFAIDPELQYVDAIIDGINNTDNLQISYAFKSTNRKINNPIFEKLDKAMKIANSEENRSSSLKKLLENGEKTMPGKTYIGLTPSDGILNKYRQKSYEDSELRIQNDADKLYKDLPEDTKIFHPFTKEKLTKDEYINYRTSAVKHGAYMGKITEIALTLPLIRNELQVKEMLKELEDLFVKANEFRDLRNQYLPEKLRKGKINENYFTTRFGWAINSETYPNKILQILGVDLLNNPDTKYVFQPVMTSSILGVKSVLDMLIEHEPHVYSIVDFKSGFKFGELGSSIPLKFYRGLNSDFMDNPQTMAKLQIMWEAVLVRLNDPKASFHSLKAAWITGKDSLNKQGILYHVDPKDFIKLIEDFIKVEYPTEYEQLKIADPQLFDYRTYTQEGPEAKEIKKKFTTSQEDRLLSDITQEIVFRQTFMSYMEEGSKSFQDEKIRRLYDTYLDYTPDNAQKLMPFLKVGEDFKNIRDLSLGEYWLGSFYNIKHSVISAALEVVHKQMIKVTSAYQRDNLILKQLLTKIAIKYVKGSNPDAINKLKNILADPASNLSIAFKKIFGSYDQELLNGWIYRTEFNDATSQHEKVMATTEEELLENVKNNPKYSWIMENGKIGKPFIDLMHFLNDRYSSILDHSREDSLWNKQLAYKLDREQNKEKVTFGDEINSSEYRKAKPFIYIKGWFPKVAKMESEFDKISFKGKFKEFMRKYFTNFYELAFDEYNNNAEIIPLRGLGNSVSSMEGEYSLSIENQFETFMKSAYGKMYLTDAHSFIEAIKVKNQDKETKKPILPRLEAWLNAQQDLALKGRRAVMTSPWSRPLPFTFSFDDKETGQAIKVMQSFNLGKALLSLGTLTSYIRLGFNIRGGIKNTLGIMMSSVTEASKQSIMQKLYNDPKYTSFVKDFTTMGAGEFAKALKPAIGVQVDAMKGKLNSNKAWVLMNKFGYIPSISPLRSERKYFVTSNNNALSMDLALLPYSTSEEVLVSTFFIAQMNHIKIQRGPMKGKSLWDMYEQQEVIDPSTGITYTDYVYKKDEDGEDYVRGVVTDANGNIEKLTGLSNKELMAMHAIYEEKQGGFATLDRTLIESTVMGQVLVQFRRHLQSILRHGLQSYGENYIKGRYQDTKKLDEKGNPIYEFSAKTVEGKWMTMAGCLLHYLPKMSKIFGKNTSVTRFVDANFPKGLDEYSWDKLDQGQKENLIDFTLNMGVWAVMEGLQWLAFGSNPDGDDRVLQLTDQIINETLQHWFLWQMYKDLQQGPAAFKVLSSLIGGSAQLTMSTLLWGIDKNIDNIDVDEDSYLDKNDHLRGLMDVAKVSPIVASTRTTYLTALDLIGDEE